MEITRRAYVEANTVQYCTAAQKDLTLIQRSYLPHTYFVRSSTSASSHGNGFVASCHRSVVIVFLFLAPTSQHGKEFLLSGPDSVVFWDIAIVLGNPQKCVLTRQKSFLGKAIFLRMFPKGSIPIFG